MDKPSPRPSPGPFGACPLPEERASKEERATISRLAGRNRRIPEALLRAARLLRARQTPAELVLWECLRSRRLFGAKFRRQHPIGPIIADFYCHEARLIIEADGPIHLDQKEHDASRDGWAREHGLRVLRFTNEDILSSTEQVLETIVAALDLGPPHPEPSPRGEGRPRRGRVRAWGLFLASAFGDNRAKR